MPAIASQGKAAGLVRVAVEPLAIDVGERAELRCLRCAFANSSLLRLLGDVGVASLGSLHAKNQP